MERALALADRQCRDVAALLDERLDDVRGLRHVERGDAGVGRIKLTLEPEVRSEGRLHAVI